MKGSQLNKSVLTIRKTICGFPLSFYDHDRQFKTDVIALESKLVVIELGVPDHFEK